MARWFAMSTLFLRDPKIEALGEAHGPAAVSVSVALLSEAMIQGAGGAAEVSFRVIGHDSFTDAETAEAVISDAAKVGFIDVTYRDERSARVVFKAWSRYQATFRKAISRARKAEEDLAPQAALGVDVTTCHDMSQRHRQDTDKTQTVRTTPSSAAKPPTREEAPLSHLLADLVAENDPNGKRPRVALRWANAERLMIEKDGRDRATAERLIRWTMADPFWSANVRSMPKFRERYGQLYQRMVGQRTGRAQQGHDRARELAERARQLREREASDD